MSASPDDEHDIADRLCVGLRASWDADPKGTAWTFDHITRLLAGMAAHQLVVDDDSWWTGSADDRAHALRIARATTPNERAARRLLEIAFTRAQGIVVAHWPQVEVIARGLDRRGELSGDEARELFNRPVRRSSGNTASYGIPAAAPFVPAGELLYRADGCIRP